MACRQICKSKTKVGDDDEKIIKFVEHWVQKQSNLIWLKWDRGQSVIVRGFFLLNVWYSESERINILKVKCILSLIHQLGFSDLNINKTNY